MQELILVVHTLSAVGLIGLVLVQQGKGADVGAAFGTGSSQTLFGARGAANFLTRITAALATLFFLTSLTLVYFSTRHTAPVSVTAPSGQVPGAAPGQAPNPPEQTGQPGEAPPPPKAPEIPATKAPQGSAPAAPPPVPK